MNLNQVAAKLRQAGFQIERLANGAESFSFPYKKETIVVKLTEAGQIASKPQGFKGRFKLYESVAALTETLPLTRAKAKPAAKVEGPKLAKAENALVAKPTKPKVHDVPLIWGALLVNLPKRKKPLEIVWDGDKLDAALIDLRSKLQGTTYNTHWRYAGDQAFSESRILVKVGKADHEFMGRTAVKALLAMFPEPEPEKEEPVEVEEAEYPEAASVSRSLAKATSRRLSAQAYRDWMEGGEDAPKFEEAIKAYLGDALFETLEQTARLPNFLAHFLNGTTPKGGKIGGVAFTPYLEMFNSRKASPKKGGDTPAPKGKPAGKTPTLKAGPKGEFAVGVGTRITWKLVGSAPKIEGKLGETATGTITALGKMFGSDIIRVVPDHRRAEDAKFSGVEALVPPAKVMGLAPTVAPAHQADAKPAATVRKTVTAKGLLIKVGSKFAPLDFQNAPLVNFLKHIPTMVGTKFGVDWKWSVKIAEPCIEVAVRGKDTRRYEGKNAINDVLRDFAEDAAQALAGR
jgi:hypothetical protein